VVLLWTLSPSPRYYCNIYSHPHSKAVNIVPITAGLPWLPWYSCRSHYREFSIVKYRFFIKRTLAVSASMLAAVRHMTNAVNFEKHKPQSRFSRLWFVVSVWVMLHMRIKVHSPTLPPGPSQSGTSHWVSWHHAYINLLTVIAQAQQLQSDIVHG